MVAREENFRKLGLPWTAVLWTVWTRKIYRAVKEDVHNRNLVFSDKREEKQFFSAFFSQVHILSAVLSRRTFSAHAMCIHTLCTSPT